MNQAFLDHAAPFLSQSLHECQVVADSENQHDNPGKDERGAKVAHRAGAAPYYFCLRQLEEELKDGETETDQRQRGTNDRHQGPVRTQAGSLERHPVPRADSSSETCSRAGLEATGPLVLDSIDRQLHCRK